MEKIIYVNEEKSADIVMLINKTFLLFHHRELLNEFYKVFYSDKTFCRHASSKLEEKQFIYEAETNFAHCAQLRYLADEQFSHSP